ncbi:hypothetical protein AYI69_g9085 [Smittium culicis]|uniref:Uncharacterized protein n=1 Tax=Smittium culicis TaxID=133412 RepID=A0A1R1XEZ8_9FUNG|nr:hypothetical protein AYI69_g9085 [Smittium culicis]
MRKQNKRSLFIRSKAGNSDPKETKIQRDDKSGKTKPLISILPNQNIGNTNSFNKIADQEISLRIFPEKNLENSNYCKPGLDLTK